MLLMNWDEDSYQDISDNQSEDTWKPTLSSDITEDILDHPWEVLCLG